MPQTEQEKDLTIKDIGALIAIVVVFLAALFFSLNWAYAQYHVWHAGMEGRAELNKADYSRQILVREALAKKDAAIMLAQAEVERALGVAKANKIIGDSLEHNEAYLRYLWIQNLENGKNQVIYVPTEANLPILEANRFNNLKK